MPRLLVMLILLVVLIPSIVPAETNADAAQYWSQWRGPLGTGAAPDSNPPIEWGEESNIRWKTSLPGIGYATPVIWGDDIFVTTAIPPEDGAQSQQIKYVVMAINRADGQVRWERLAREDVPHQGVHRTSTWATGSPITDGERVYAFFGSRGLYCLTIDGDPLWAKDFGDMDIRNDFGEGATPALYGNRLIVPWDHEGQSFIVVLDATTGDEIWRKNRDEVTTWMTPLVVDVAGKQQVITSGTNRVRSYDLASGDLIWEDDGLTANVIPSPVAADGIVYLTSGHRGNALRAVRLSEAKGRITGTPAILWTYDQDTPYTPSSLLHDGYLYFLKSNNGILTCLDISTGQPAYSNQRLEGISSIYASPTASRDSIYLMGREGTALVVRHGPAFDVLSTNTLNDNFDASPVIVGDDIFLRGHQYLYCIGR